jgi:hypothetical protein
MEEDMSDTVSRFPKGPSEGGGDSRGDPDDVKEPAEPNDSPIDGDWLDIEHLARVNRVLACDTARSRMRARDVEIARLVEEEQMLWSDLRDLGGDEHVDAIMRSGWYPYARAIIASSRLAWILDAVLWTALWLSVWALAMRALGHE